MSENLSPLRDIKEELQDAKTHHAAQLDQSFKELSGALVPLYREHISSDAPIKFIPTKLERSKGRNTVVFTVVDPTQPGVNIGPFITNLIESESLHNFRVEFPSFAAVSASLPHMPREFKKGLEQVLRTQSTDNAKSFFDRLNTIKAQWATRNKALIEKQAKIDEIEKRLAELSKPVRNGAETTRQNEKAKLLKQLYQTYLPGYAEFTRRRIAKLNKTTRLSESELEKIAAHFDKQHEEAVQKSKATEKDYPNLAKLVRTGIADVPSKRLMEYMKKARKPTFYGDVTRTEKAIANGVPEDLALNHYSTVIKKADPQTQWALKQHPFDNVLLATQLIPRPKGALALLEKAQKVKQHLPASATNEIAMAISRTLGRDEPSPENIRQVINGEKTDVFINVLAQIPDATTHLASLDVKNQVIIIPRANKTTTRKMPVVQTQSVKQRQQALHDKLVWSEQVMDEIKKQPFTAAELAKALIYGFNLANRKVTAVGKAYFRGERVKKNILKYLDNDATKHTGLMRFLRQHNLIIEHKTAGDSPVSLDLNEQGKSEVGKSIAQEVKRFMYEVRK